MKAEQLKVIAEGMGYEYRHYISNEENTLMVSKDLNIAEYNPLTNNDQMVEIMERLKIDIIYDDALCEWKAGIATADYYGKTINEAACNAAYEYFKQRER